MRAFIILLSISFISPIAFAETGCNEKLLIHQDNIRLRCGQGTGASESIAIDNALDMLAKSISVEVSSQTSIDVVAGEHYREEFHKRLTSDSQAQLFGVDIQVNNSGDEYVATALIDVEFVASRYVELLLPLIDDINARLPERFEFTSDTQKFRFYSANLDRLLAYSNLEQMAKVMIALADNPKLSAQLPQSKVTYSEALTFIDLQNDSVLNDAELAALVIAWQLRNKQLQNSYLCPVFARDGKRLSQFHRLPATLALELGIGTENTKSQNYLYAKATAFDGYHQIEFYLSDLQGQSLFVAGVKLNLQQKDWDIVVNSANFAERVGILLDVSQSFVDKQGDSLHVKSLTRKQLTNVLNKGQSAPPIWIEPDICIESAFNNQQQKLMQYGARFGLKVNNQVVKRQTLIKQAGQQQAISYVESDFEIRFSDGLNHSNDFSLTGHAKAPSFIDDNDELLRQVNENVLADMELNLLIKTISNATVDDYLKFNLNTFEFDFSFKQRDLAIASLIQNNSKQNLELVHSILPESGGQKASFYYNRACATRADCELSTQSVIDSGGVKTDHKVTLGIYIKNPSQQDSTSQIYHRIVQSMLGSFQLLALNRQNIVALNEQLEVSGAYAADEKLTSKQLRGQMILKGYQQVLVIEVYQANSAASYVEAEILVAVVNWLKNENIAVKAFYHRGSNITKVVQKLADNISAFAALFVNASSL